MPNNTDQPGLNDLAVFLAIVEAGGFRAAAQRLGLSPSTVSDKLSQLERSLGLPLLVRTTRSVMPTPTGRALANRLSPLLAEARAALHDAASSRHSVRGVLKLNVTGAVMIDILPPLIDRFLQRYPEVRVDIVVEERFIDITAAGCDAGVRYGEDLARDAIAVPLGPRRQTFGFAASPAYLAAHGIPENPQALAGHDCIRLRYAGGGLVKWRLACGEEKITLDPPGRLTLGIEAAAAAIDFARKGYGIIGCFANWLGPWIDQGELQPVLPACWTHFDGPRLYFPNRSMPAPLRAFVDLIKAEREDTASVTDDGPKAAGS